jgi:hypothetical protein
VKNDMVYVLDEILRNGELGNSDHDRIIARISHDNKISPNINTIYTKASYKIRDLEGEIDLVQTMHDFKKHMTHDYLDVPVDETKIILFEIKTHHSKKNESKAVDQLKRSKYLIQRYTAYKDVDCCYGFGLNKGYMWRYLEVI